MNIVKLLYVIGFIIILFPFIFAFHDESALSSGYKRPFDLMRFFNLLPDAWYWFLAGFIYLLFGYYVKSNPKLKRFGKYIAIISVALLVIFSVLLWMSLPTYLGQ